VKPQYVVSLVALVLVGGALAFMSYTTGGVGTVTTTDAGITRIYAKVEPDAEVSVPIALLEGSDVAHESDHVFDALNGRPGIREATIKLDGSAIVVRYSSAEIREADIIGSLATAGYASNQ